MYTLVTSLLSSHVPFVHFDGGPQPVTISPEARLLIGAGAEAPLEVLAGVARHIAAALPALAIPREFSLRTGSRSIQVGAVPVAMAPGRVDVLMVLSAGPVATPRCFDDRHLTAREREIAEKVAVGMPSPAIARLLGISVHTVRRHTERVFSKTGVKTRAELVRFASVFQATA